MNAIDSINSQVSHSADLRNGEVVEKAFALLEQMEKCRTYGRPGYPDIHMDFPRWELDANLVSGILSESGGCDDAYRLVGYSTSESIKEIEGYGTRHHSGCE